MPSMGERPGTAPGWRPHAVLDSGSRRLKAIKIERLLGLLDWRIGEPLRLLEIGVGGGGIAAYFGSHPSRRFEVWGVDTLDQRVAREGFRFDVVTGTSLPFESAFFDVVISNHVIEHVGEEPEQRRHLAEIRRVLREGGRAYLALPSRWMLVEPHFRLPFLSWLPQGWSDAYVQLMGRGTHYDCRPLTAFKVEALIGEAGFQYEQRHWDALVAMSELEGSGGFMVRLVPQAMAARVSRWVRRAYPTLIYTLGKPASGG